MYIYTCTYIHVHIHWYVYVWVCRNVCMYVCMYVCMHVCIYIYMYVYTHTYIYVWTLCNSYEIHGFRLCPFGYTSWTFDSTHSQALGTSTLTIKSRWPYGHLLLVNQSPEMATDPPQINVWVSLILISGVSNVIPTASQLTCFVRFWNKPPWFSPPRFQWFVRNYHHVACCSHQYDHRIPKTIQNYSLSPDFASQTARTSP